VQKGKGPECSSWIVVTVTLSNNIIILKSKFIFGKKKYHREERFTK
jgi:hypothetical protein